MASLVLLAWLGGCQYRPGTEPAPTAPQAVQPWPPFDYEAAAGQGANVYRLDPRRTQVDIVVRSDGPLARFGHDHAIVVLQPRGYLLLADPVLKSRADLQFDMRNLEIDPPAARLRHGLDPDMSAEDIEGTRRNLLERVLDPGRDAGVTLSLTDFECRDASASAKVAFALQGLHYSARQVFTLQAENGHVTVEGSFVLRHGDLGLEPYSAFGGSLKVADSIEIHFSLAGSTF